MNRNGTKRAFDQFNLLEIDLGASFSFPCFCVIATSLAKNVQVPTARSRAHEPKIIKMIKKVFNNSRQNLHRKDYRFNDQGY